MIDKVTLERIKTLHPKVREEVLSMCSHICNNILTKNVSLRLAYTLRTNKEQDDLYAQGRTNLFDNSGKRLGIVTKAKAGESIHNYGLAFDIVFMIDKDENGSYETASWDTKADYDKDGVADWMEVVKYIKSCGWVWGGDFKSIKDAPHFEKTFGHTWQTLKELVDSGKVVVENNIKYPKI